MKNKIKNILLGTIPFAAILILWQISNYFSWIPRWLVPSPHKVLMTGWQLISDGSLFGLIYASAMNALPAFIIAVTFALTIGTLIGISQTARKIFQPLLAAIYPIPSLAWLPFIILFLGFTRQAIWSIVFISSFLKMIYNVIGGVQSVNKTWILAAKNLGLSKTNIIFRVILPGSLPQIMTGLRMGWGSSWKSLIGAEMLLSTLGGLGKFIWTAQWYFNFDKLLVGIITIALIGLIMEQLVFRRFEKITLMRWGLIREEG